MKQVRSSDYENTQSKNAGVSNRRYTITFNEFAPVGSEYRLHFNGTDTYTDEFSFFEWALLSNADCHVGLVTADVMAHYNGSRIVELIDTLIIRFWGCEYSSEVKQAIRAINTLESFGMEWVAKKPTTE